MAETEIEIKESDKPFILALVSAGITFANIIITAVGALTNNVAMKDAGLETLKFTFPLTTMAWVFYFKTEK